MGQENKAGVFDWLPKPPFGQNEPLREVTIPPLEQLSWTLHIGGKSVAE